MSLCHETRIAYSRTGRGDGLPIVLLHAGIADRRMWDDVLTPLSASREVVRLDLRGYGESTTRPDGPWSQRDDVTATLDALGIDRAHFVGCSLGAGVCAEVAVTRPDLVASLVLAAPGGALITEATDELRAFFRAEGTALEAGDLDAAVEANLRAWVDGPQRGPTEVRADLRAAVGVMQRRAFELTADWPDSTWEAETELDPPLTERLGEVTAPTLVIFGARDVDAIRLAADHVAAGIAHARAVLWPDVAHLPPMERPEEFASAVLDWVDLAEAAGPRQVPDRGLES